jgi:hypothetical protein
LGRGSGWLSHNLKELRPFVVNRSSEAAAPLAGIPAQAGIQKTAPAVSSGGQNWIFGFHRNDECGTRNDAAAETSGATFITRNDLDRFMF